MWHDTSLPLAARVELGANAGKALVPLAIVLGICLLALGNSSACRKQRRSAPSRVVCIASTAAVFSAVLLYAASWISFESTGAFLNLSGFELLRVAPGQALQYVTAMAPLGAIAIAVTGAAVAALALIRVIAPRLRRASEVTCRRFFMLSLIATESCFVAAGWGNATFAEDTSPLREHSSGSSYDVAQAYVVDRDERTSPMAHLLAQYNEWRLEEAIPHVALTVAVDTPAIIPMEHYVSNARRGHWHHWNVIVLEVESLRADQLMVDGGRRLVMPNLEALARDARIYVHALTTATHSNYAAPVPLSGQYPLRSSTDYIYPPHPSYPRVLIYDILKHLGYHTAIMSSQNELWGGMYYFLNTGNVDHFLHSETFRGPTYVPVGDYGFAHFISEYKRAGVIDDKYTVSEAIDWLDSLYVKEQSSDPFFMYMNLQSSHVPYQRPSDFPPRFGSGRVSFPIGFGKFPPDSAGAVLDMYDNSLAYLDAQIGRLVDYLDSHGLRDSTIIVLTGDHGQAFFEHDFAAHANLPFAELVRVPLIIHAPGLARETDERPAQHVDIAPTILSLLRLPPHPAYQGSTLIAPDPSPDRPLFIVAQSALANGYSIVRGRYTLIFDAAHDREMLFDDLQDPLQRIDLAGRFPAVRDSLRHDLDMWREVQLDYYEDKADQAQWYAPTLRFPPLHDRTRIASNSFPGQLSRRR